MFTLTVCATLLLASLCASAENVPEWPVQLQGRRVRLRGPSIAEGTLVGDVVATEGETPVLMPEDGSAARRVPLAEDLRVQVSRTTSKRIRKGLLEGAAIGGLAYGAPAAIVIHLSDECYFGGRECRPLMVKAVAAGALVGAVVGVTLHVIGDSLGAGPTTRPRQPAARTHARPWLACRGRGPFLGAC